jgi:hypothetical protein
MIFYLVKQILACVLVFVKIQHALLQVILSHLARQQCRLQAEARERDIN